MTDSTFLKKNIHKIENNAGMQQIFAYFLGSAK